jgi:hypothetical protein
LPSGLRLGGLLLRRLIPKLYISDYGGIIDHLKLYNLSIVSKLSFIEVFDMAEQVLLGDQKKWIRGLFHDAGINSIKLTRFMFAHHMNWGN